MKSIGIFVLALMITASTNAAAKEKIYEDIDHEIGEICHPHLQSKCWKPLADMLAQVKKPATEQETLDQLFPYWMLAKAAYYAGDYSDSARFYAATLELTKNARFPGKHELEPEFPLAIVKTDMAALALSTRDYATALQYLNEYLALTKGLVSPKDSPDEASLMRCAALIGLKRTADAKQALQDLMQKLDFNGQSPWEGFPVGPQPLDPYRTARRIAAYHIRTGDYDQALAIIHMIGAKRLETISAMPKEPSRGGYWAQRTSPADIMDDEAAVYLAQGRDDQAEPLLRTSLPMREKESGPQLKRVLTRLAGIDNRAGRTDEASKFAARAAAIQPEEKWNGVDPLADTLGFAD